MRQLAIPQLYRSIHGYLLQQIPDACDSRLTNMIYLMMGIFSGRSVQLNLLVRKLPIQAKKLSRVRRLSRFLDNPAVQVRRWYAPFAKALLEAAAVSGQVRLIIDASKVAFGYRLLMVSVAYRRRSLPLAWTWVAGTRGHSSTRQQLALLNYVRTLVPPNVGVLLVGDGEFSAGKLMDYLHAWHWQYVLRLACDTQVWVHGQTTTWQRVDSWRLSPNTPLFFTQLTISQAYPVGANLLLFHASGEDKPWYLVTNLRAAAPVLQAYRRRMWIEEMFGDMKKHGFDLEASHLRSFVRLSRLTLAVALLYLWLVALGEYVHVHRLWTLIDRQRADLSIFRWGWDFLEHCLSLDDPIPVVSLPNFCSVSGS